MALTDAIAAYDDCEKLFDRAIANPKGIRACLGLGEPGKKAAHYLRMRLNHYRQLQRRESMKIYDRTDPRYGKSLYDRFFVRLAEDDAGEWWVYIDPAGQESLIVAVEELE